MPPSTKIRRSAENLPIGHGGPGLPVFRRRGPASVHWVQGSVADAGMEIQRSGMCATAREQCFSYTQHSPVRSRRVGAKEQWHANPIRT